MGNTVCVPIANRYRVPSCAVCEKEAKKPFNKLSCDEKRIWVFHEGQIYCTKCLITHRVEKFQREKSSQFQRRVTEVVAERYVRPPRESALRKVLSGKAWDKTSSFKAPYVESPSVTEKLQRYSRSLNGSVQEKRISSTSGSSGSKLAGDLNINRPIGFAGARNDDAKDATKEWDNDGGLGLKRRVGGPASACDDGDDSICGSDCNEGDECEGEASSGEANNACGAASGHRRRKEELDSDGENNDGDYDDDDADADSCASENFEDLINHIEEKRRTKNFGAAGRFSFVLDDATEVESVDLLPATPRVENERQPVEAIT